MLKVYCKYTLNEAEIAGAISSVIAGSGMTPNRYITTAIREKLVRDGYLTEYHKNTFLPMELSLQKLG